MEYSLYFTKLFQNNKTNKIKRKLCCFVENRNRILSETCVGITKEQLMHMYSFATAKKFDVFLIHLEKNPAERFHHNFTKLMNPEAFYHEVMGV